LGRGRELHALTGQAGADRDRDPEMCLAGARGSQEDHVLFGVQKVELSEVLDDGLLHAALEREVELLEGLAGGEPRRFDPSLPAVTVASGHLGGEQRFREALIAPLLLAGAVGEHRHRSRRSGSLQGAEQVREL
jgi:hypothetical protein